MTNPRITDNDTGEITVALDGEELRGWSYANDGERRQKMLQAREYVEGWCDAKGSNAVAATPLAYRLDHPAHGIELSIRQPDEDWAKRGWTVTPLYGGAAQCEQEPTEAQINSACLSYDHSFGLMDGADRAMVRFEAREWLRAWQKEGFGSDRNEIIERCAQVVDQANREGPYQAIAAASRIRELKGSMVSSTEGK